MLPGMGPVPGLGGGGQSGLPSINSSSSAESRTGAVTVGGLSFAPAGSVNKAVTYGAVGLAVLALLVSVSGKGKR